MHEIPVDSSIAERGGTLKRTSQLPTPDALIAATALAHELPLMTRNRRHFDRVVGLRLQAPHESSNPPPTEPHRLHVTRVGWAKPLAQGPTNFLSSRLRSLGKLNRRPQREHHG